ncbi:hypothetical protein H8D83_02205 [Candidatus Woesearchaeota archaeon]|nr:hypothetical protein [Candidatus Woesearchaeota archaeon]
MTNSNLFDQKHLYFNDSLINIIFFGPGYGESILLYLPGLGWGIIDSCSVKIKKEKINPALEYLKSQKVKNLAFLILTHPHLDHYKGLEDILYYFMGAIDRICYYSGAGLEEYARYLIRKKIINEPGLLGLKNILDLFQKAKESGSNLMRLAERTQIIRKKHYGNHMIEMISLSPSENSEREYCERLYNCIPIDKPASIKDLKKSDQNLISSAIWCEIDDKRFVFGSDLENHSSRHSGWNGVLNNKDVPNLSALFVKIPHHGSPNAYNDNIWRVFSKDQKPLSVVTPYSKTTALRPDPNTIKNISKFSKDIYVTSRITFEKPQKIYKELDSTFVHGIESWKYIKLPNQLGFIKTTIQTNPDPDIEIFVKKPAYKY